MDLGLGVCHPPPQVGSHQLNMESSRSHAIFTIYCDATPTGGTQVFTAQSSTSLTSRRVCCTAAAQHLHTCSQDVYKLGRATQWLRHTRHCLAGYSTTAAAAMGGAPGVYCT